jgi:tetratricopeptide (TPR) repeat protein
VIRLIRRGLLLVAGAAAFQSEARVIVESMGTESALERSGVKVGDALTSWKLGESTGEFRSPVDVGLVEIEYGRRPGFVLHVHQAGKQRAYTPSPAVAWATQVRPKLTPQELEIYQRASAATADGRWKEAARSFEMLSEALARQKRVRDSVWLLVRAATAQGLSQRFVDSGRLIDVAVRRAEAAGDPELAAWTLHTIGTQLWDWGQYPESERRVAAALRIRERLAPESLITARTLWLLSRLAAVRNDLQEAHRHSSRMLAITQASVPGSLLEAEAHYQLGSLAYWNDDTDTALIHLRRALSITARVGPKGVGEATTLVMKGHVHRHRGELQLAQQHYEQGDAINQRLRPGTPAEAEAKMSLGYVALERRDLEVAIRYLAGSVAIYESYAPGSLGTEHLAKIHAALGESYRLRGDLAAARVYLERSLVHQRRLAGKSSFEESLTLANLADVALEQRDLTTAERYQRQSVAIARALGSTGAHLGARLLGLARIEMASGRRPSVREHLAEAEKILGRSAPQGLAYADALTTLGEYHLDGEDPALASAPLTQAASIVARIAPGTALEARPLYLLARLERTTGNPHLARGMYARALDALESQRKLLGRSDDVHVQFIRRFAPYYLDYIDLLVSLDEPVEAFAILERYRARALLEAFRSRSEVESARVPPSLAQDYERASYRYDRAFEASRELQMNCARHASSATLSRNAFAFWKLPSQPQR